MNIQTYIKKIGVMHIVIEAL